MWSRTMHFDSNHIGKIAEMHKFCPAENVIVLSLQSSKGLSLKKCRENVEKMPAPLAEMRMYRLRHALPTRLSPSHVLTGLQKLSS